jgi:hypothetical protein
MEAKKAFALIGKKLEKEYKRLGFKYSKRKLFLQKRTRKYDYFIFFSQFFESIPDLNIELYVSLIINDRALIKSNIYANCEVFHMNLWKAGNRYNIAGKALIDNVFMDLKNKIEINLIPQIKKLEEEIL